jgi:hypothetical protein
VLRPTTESEPCNLREWRVKSGHLFTCGRPGRGHYSSADKKWPVIVPDDILHAWVDGLPPFGPLNIVSLLGEKYVGKHSEFKHYPFRSCFETGSKATFQAWLDANCHGRFRVHEFQTVDADPAGIPLDEIARITACVQGLLAQGEAVVIVDSAGVSRTGRVCREMGLTESQSLRGHCAR